MLRPLPMMLAALGLALALAATSAQAGPGEPDARATVWLVRHAEAGEGPDPSLTEAGLARADGWHRQLGAPVLRRVYATDTRRSRQTAAGIAADAGAEVELYDPADPDALVRRVVERNEPAVVVAHSNTLNPLAQALGAGPGLAEIAHDEHGRVYALPIPSPAGSGTGAAARPGVGVQSRVR